MRVVADTNTVVSAFLWGGAPAAVLIAARRRHIELVSSRVLLDELSDVLRREKFASRIERVGSSVDLLVANYRSLIAVVEPLVVAPVARDPDDDALLACAIAAQANLIVTGDNDLLVLQSLRGIRILAARDALVVIAGSPHG